MSHTIGAPQTVQPTAYTPRNNRTFVAVACSSCGCS